MVNAPELLGLSGGVGFEERTQAVPMFLIRNALLQSVNVLYSPPELPSRRPFLFACIPRAVSIGIDAREYKIEQRTSASSEGRLS
jgi:hypothetical protein